MARYIDGCEAATAIQTKQSKVLSNDKPGIREDRHNLTCLCLSGRFNGHRSIREKRIVVRTPQRDMSHLGELHLRLRLRVH